MLEFRVRFSDEQEVLVEVGSSATFEEVAVKVSSVRHVHTYKQPVDLALWCCSSSLDPEPGPGTAAGLASAAEVLAHPKHC
jgi:hypothetical protein